MSSVFFRHNKKKWSKVDTSNDHLTPLEEENKPVDKDNKIEAEDIDENFFYKHIITHFHNLFCEAAIICIPHSKSIAGLVITKDIIESHCFLSSPYYYGQYVAAKQKNKIIELDIPIITTISGFKEVRTVNILSEESVYIRNKKIRLLLINRLLEGEPPKYPPQQLPFHIPPERNFRADLDFLNLFNENQPALRELHNAVHEFTDTFVYIKGYNRITVERIQLIYMNTYNTILQNNSLLRSSCRAPSEHHLFLALIENVVMGLLHKKIWIQSLQSLLASNDSKLEVLSFHYSNVTLAQYSLRYPISEMPISCFSKAIMNFKRLDSDSCGSPILRSQQDSIAVTPLEKTAVLKSTLDLISSAVHDYAKDFGNGHSDTSVTSDEMIPLLAFVIVQSCIPRIASTLYYMQYYRLARMMEGSVYSFAITTMKAACEYLKDDPLGLHDGSSATSVMSSPSSVVSAQFKQHRKTQSADFYGLNHADYDKDSIEVLNGEDPHGSRRNSTLLRSHIVLPYPRDYRKSLDMPDKWMISTPPTSSHTYAKSSRNLGSSKPLISTTFPSISSPFPIDLMTDKKPATDPVSEYHNRHQSVDSPRLGRSLSTSTTIKQPTVKPPTVISIRDRISFDGIRRPASICCDTRSFDSTEDRSEKREESLGDFIGGLTKIEGDVVGSFSSYRHI
ncbi:hypothetical protein BDB01DRAFT_852928 [Pilobolus umbonatus]|nr:hypothetical protein BDB01DRAFT_852928 [Pilobolus umbonatus]